MLRHLPRLVAGVNDALGCDRLRRGDLALLQPYQPSLSAAWLFQRCTSKSPSLKPP
jgi:lycopene cyclase CruP